ncbi:MAG: phosphomannomutase/phosphoglucomutase [Deltaproteobacteria bacterium]|nr:phosphomannomutase/phosphoglucomutase [Deltaproteobacteria bacterium]
MNPRVFREYDIRGVAERDFPSDFVFQLGNAIGAHFRAIGAKTVTLGRDARLSSPRIHGIIKDRLLTAGLDVIDVGIVHTPGLYFSVFHLEADGGVMITASHNPGEDNGFKIVRGRSTIYGDEIQELKRRIEEGRYTESANAVPGTARDVDILTPYVEHIFGNLRLGAKRPKVVLDAGNGTGGLSCLPLLRKLGFDVDPLYCDPDGRYPNHHPDPTVAENMADLIARVQSTGAEVGIALDGDADRIGVVDARGRIVWGDQLMILFAREILKEVPGATFVSEVKCSQALYDDIERLGGRAIMWKVGHSLIKVKMKEEHALLAGEMSGHMFFAHRYFGFDDAVYAAARLMEMLSQSPKTLTELVDTLPVLFNTPEIRLDCPDDLKKEVVRQAAAHFKRDHAVNEIDGARIQFEGGWGLVRASNTGPVLVLRCEADSQARCDAIRATLEAELGRIRSSLQKTS